MSTCVETVLMVTSLSPTCPSMIHQIDTLTNGGSNLPFSESGLVNQISPGGVAHPD